MPDDIDHKSARRFAAHYQPKHQLAQPYLDMAEKYERAEKALRQILNIAAEPGEAGAMKALKEARRNKKRPAPKDRPKSREETPKEGGLSLSAKLITRWLLALDLPFLHSPRCLYGINLIARHHENVDSPTWNRADPT